MQQSARRNNPASGYTALALVDFRERQSQLYSQSLLQKYKERLPAHTDGGCCGW